MCLFCKLRINCRQKYISGFQNSHLRAQTRPDAAQLQTNHTGADHTQSLWDCSKFKRSCRVDNDILVDGCGRNLDRLRTCRQNNMIGLQFLRRTVSGGDQDLFAFQKFACALDALDLVCRKQTFNTLSQLLDDVCFAIEHRRHINAQLFHGDAVNSKSFFGFRILVR